MDKSQRGFIMVEALVAIIIISVALLSIVGMFIQSTRANASAADYTAATNLAQKQLELLKAKPYSFWAGLSLPGSGSTVGIVWQDAAESTANPAAIKLNNITYTATTQAMQCPEDTTNLVQVVVTVSWYEQTGNKSIQMTAFYPKIQ